MGVAVACSLGSVMIVLGSIPMGNSWDSASPCLSFLSEFGHHVVGIILGVLLCVCAKVGYN